MDDNLTYRTRRSPSEKAEKKESSATGESTTTATDQGGRGSGAGVSGRGSLRSRLPLNPLPLKNSIKFFDGAFLENPDRELCKFYVEVLRSAIEAELERCYGGVEFRAAVKAEGEVLDPTVVDAGRKEKFLSGGRVDD